MRVRRKEPLPAFVLFPVLPSGFGRLNTEGACVVHYRSHYFSILKKIREQGFRFRPAGPAYMGI